MRTQGERRFGSRGKSDVLRMLGSPQKSITTRSSPMPPPACGKAPYLNESTYAWMGVKSTGGSLAAACAKSISGSWIRCAPDVTCARRWDECEQLLVHRWEARNEELLSP